jgi:hypothetical protein
MCGFRSAHAMRLSTIVAVFACFIAGWHLTKLFRPSSPDDDDDGYARWAYPAIGGLAMAAAVVLGLFLTEAPPVAVVESRVPIDTAGLAIPEPGTSVAPPVSPPPVAVSPAPVAVSPAPLPSPPAADPLTTTIPL